ncbi:MAG: hypothetical protein V4548_01460, partial [Bacteroidota bacterium]
YKFNSSIYKFNSSIYKFNFSFYKFNSSLHYFSFQGITKSPPIRRITPLAEMTKFRLGWKPLCI